LLLTLANEKGRETATKNHVFQPSEKQGKKPTKKKNTKAWAIKTQITKKLKIKCD